MKLDPAQRHILTLLQKDSTLSTQALADKAEEQEDSIGPVYDKVFASPIDHSHDYEVPGVIKTYAEAADVGERREREAQDEDQDQDHDHDEV